MAEALNVPVESGVQVLPAVSHLTSFIIKAEGQVKTAATLEMVKMNSSLFAAELFERAIVRGAAKEAEPTKMRCSSLAKFNVIGLEAVLTDRISILNNAATAAYNSVKLAFDFENAVRIGSPVPSSATVPIFMVCCDIYSNV